jgi:hypothetical protein
MTIAQPAEKQDTIRRNSFGKMLQKPLKWIREHWNVYDPAYSVPTFYDWAARLQNTTTMEWLVMESPEGMEIKMHSNMSNRIGPYFGYRWLFYGATVDLNSLGSSSKRKDEFTLSLNSNLVNIDIIRRRTGGDFSINKLKFNNPQTGPFDIAEYAEQFNMGDYIKNNLTGVNINLFTNPRRYSNPAAFSRGAVQLRSAGSPIVGMGYTHQKVESDVSEIFSTFAMTLMTFYMVGQPEFERLFEEFMAIDKDDEEALNAKALEILDTSWGYMKDDEHVGKIATSFITNRIPTSTRIDDWHLQLGYAYNLVFSRRLLLGLSAVLSPGFKRIRADNYGSVAYELADDFSRMIKKHEGVDVDPSYFYYNYDHHRFDINTFIRASLTFNYNRWQAGLRASYSNYNYKRHGLKVRNSFGSLNAYVGYCFGRKKAYRYHGDRRQEYVTAALTKRQIEEMKDTCPAGNLDKGPTYLPTEGRTKNYHADAFTLNIRGCDLVRGPEGKFGWLDIQDGYVTPGEDTEGRLSKGQRLEIDANGTFVCELGHNRSIRSSNWWKSQVSIEQVPNTWYPELLHYALRGKLTLYLRGRIFGTRKPVKMEIDDFCLNHGKETQSFGQVAIKSFTSNAPYSIEGRVMVNDRLCRVYIEQKGKGKQPTMYVSRVYPSNSNWMAKIDDRQPLNNISIPGTHDAGTAALNESPVLSTAQTQNFSVPDQLNDGIRAFDLRLKEDLSYGYLQNTGDCLDSTMVAWDRFLEKHPSEVLIAIVGSYKGGKWDEEMQRNFNRIIQRYPHRFVEDFDAKTTLKDVRGKILIIRREEECPFGKLLKFEDDAVFDYDCFHVEDSYNEHKTWKKAKLVEQNILEAYENENPDKWFITFNSIAWSPRRHTPYNYAWGERAKNIRKPMNKALLEALELKDYSNFGIVFMDFYNDHGERPQLVDAIIGSNFHKEE